MSEEVDPVVIALAKKLRLEVLESPTIKAGTVVNINAGGLVGTKRPIKDGVAYFGTSAVAVTCVKCDTNRANIQSMITSCRLKSVALAKGIFLLNTTLNSELICSKTWKKGQEPLSRCSPS